MRFASAVLLAFTVSGLAACGDAHMGEGYGRRTKTALDAQAARGGEGGLPLDGDDARMVMQQHRLGGAAVSGTGTMPSTSSYGSYGGYGGISGTTTGGVAATPIVPIRLDAR